MRGDWERITRLFEAARGLEVADRDSFLRTVCGADGDLRAELETLLAEDGQADHFLSHPAAPAVLDWLRKRADDSEPLPDTLLNRYRVEEPLASGGHALIFRALDQKLSRPVVVKVLRPQGRGDDWLKSRLRQEMEALARIDHPAVAGIVDSGELPDGSPFLVIQFIAGENLRQAMREGPPDVRRVAAIIRQIGSALGAAHSVGIAHRDLKPENIMLQRLGDGTEGIKLIDFGLAKIERDQLDPHATTVMLHGTVRYMAPEQFEGENLPASDIYSLALVACELLCGHPDSRALPAGLDRRVRRLLDEALAFDPARRPRKAGEWAADFADALVSTGRRRFMIAAGGAGAVIAGGLWAAARLRAVSEEPRVIEKVGSFDPLTEGFQIHNEISGTVADDARKTGYDGWRITSAHQGYYYRHLSRNQKRHALDRGWTLTSVVRAEEGLVLSDVDFGDEGPRFDINVICEAARDVVRLNTQIVPTQQGIEIYLPKQVPVFRRYELQYDPGLHTAALLIDGKGAAEGYRGHRQFQDDRGVMFGATIHATPRGVGTVQSVRFGINP